MTIIKTTHSSSSHTHLPPKNCAFLFNIIFVKWLKNIQQKKENKQIPIACQIIGYSSVIGVGRSAGSMVVRESYCLP